ncbi:phage major capsid protein [Brevibacillus sp. VP]|uniref:phage major capsid protein n=1 Tax=unclassified Brevibacillus TaxID=2684853 RepID=UPI000E2E5EEF|nr:phage major capsid protein [Brevibacillus sp. VP]RFB35726.1 phage major capsid protein [Brevibacillus sp. VP]
MKKAELKKLDLDKGIYQEASSNRKNLCDILEDLDPTIEYKGSSLENTTALQRQMAARGIKSSGLYADTVHKFFETTEHTILFPAYVEANIRKGIDENSIINKLVATTTKLTGTDTYKTAVWEHDEKDVRLQRVTEGAPMPRTKISLGDKEITIYRYARMLEATYQAVRNSKLNVYGLQLQQFGAQLALDEVLAAVEVLINGDGGVPGADTFKLSELGGKANEITYKPYVKFKNKFKQAYKPNIFLAKEDLYTDIITLPEFNNALLGFMYAKTGQPDKIIGAELERCDDVPENLLIGLDTRYALNRIVAAPLMFEYDKLIDTQVKQTAISYEGGFELLNKESRKVLNTGA